MISTLCSITSTPGYTVVILFGYCKPQGLKLNSLSLSFSVCLPFIPESLIIHILKAARITWIYNFQLWQAKGIVIWALRRGVSAAEWVFSLTDSLEWTCVSTCIYISDCVGMYLSVSLFFFFILSLHKDFPKMVANILIRNIQIHDPATYNQQGSTGQNSTDSLDFSVE